MPRATPTAPKPPPATEVPASLVRQPTWRVNSSHWELHQEVKAEDPKHPIFILDCPWITEPATPWWIKWNTYGDVSSHDNYPFDFHSTSLAHINGNGGGIPQTVGLAVSRSVHLE